MFTYENVLMTSEARIYISAGICVSQVGFLPMNLLMDGTLTTGKVPPCEIPHFRIQIRPRDNNSQFVSGRDESGRRSTTVCLADCDC